MYKHQFYSGLNFKCNKLIDGGTEDRLSPVLSYSEYLNFFSVCSLKGAIQVSELLDKRCGQILSIRKQHQQKLALLASIVMWTLL